MKFPDKVYRIIAISSLFILLGVQFMLIFNTFELRNKQYFLKEKDLIHKAYTDAIRNDKLYPGGQKIIDRHILNALETLKKVYDEDPNGAFLQLKDALWKSLLIELRERQSMDKLFERIVQKYDLDADLKYSLNILQLSITFDGVNYIPIYDRSKLSDSSPTPIHIAGTLSRLDKQNVISSYTVNAGTEDSYQVKFDLHVDRDNRILQILKAMSLTLILSFGSIGLVIAIYYMTYTKWMGQKKLTAMTADFLNSISHEFNTPVATILVANQSLRNPALMADPKKIKDLSAVIERQAHRLQELVQQSLMITKLSNNNIDKRNSDLASLLMESLADYSLKLDASVEIIPELEDEPMEVLLSKFLFTTMLYNLLDNAIKYNESVQKKIHVKLRHQGDFIHLTIQDNGIGISEQTLKEMFVKFYRGKNKIQEEGLGLGLHYVHQVVQLHGWTLTVNSAVGGGSIFQISIKTIQA